MSDSSGGGPGIPPGWYTDAQGTVRWWDGANWTEHVQARDLPAAGPYGPPVTRPPSGQPWYQKRRWQIPAAVVGTLIVLGILGSGGEDSGAPSTVATDLRSAPESPAATKTPSEAPSPAAATKAPAAPQAPAATKPASTSAKPTPAPQPAPSAMAVSAVEMLKEFEANEAAADIKYKGKTLKVTGTAVKVDTELWNDDQYVIEINGGARWALETVNCNDVAGPMAARVQVHRPITVIGTFDDGGDLGVDLKNCTVA